MFKARTEKIEKIALSCENKIKELENIFDKKTNIYIDFANVIPWQDKLRWKIDIKRLFQFLTSFENIDKIRFYYWTLIWDEKSEELAKQIKERGYEFITKPVKIMKKSIDISSIELTNTSILESFIRKSLLNELTIKDIEYLNNRLSELNKLWQLYIEDRKCNFDVELWVDILLDLHYENAENFVIWSWDSDFETVISRISEKNKKVYIFSVPWRVSLELNNSNAKVYDIKKLKNFICRKNDIDKKLLV